MENVFTLLHMKPLRHLQKQANLLHYSTALELAYNKYKLGKIQIFLNADLVLYLKGSYRYLNVVEANSIRIFIIKW